MSQNKQWGKILTVFDTKHTFLPILQSSVFLFISESIFAEAKRVPRDNSDWPQPISESVFAEAKPLPDFNKETINLGTQRYKFTLIKNKEKIESGSVTFRSELKGDQVILTDKYLLRHSCLLYTSDAADE